MTFYGHDLCVALKVTKMKSAEISGEMVPAPGSPHTECTEFCIPGLHGYHEVVVKETIGFDNLGEHTIERVTYKFETLS